MGDAAWRVRVLGGDGQVAVGAGVLLPGHTVLTCAHVVESALGGAMSAAAPNGEVRLEFPAAAGGGVAARVAAGGWFRSPPTADLAVLELADSPPRGAAGAPVDGAVPPDGAEVMVFGHPARLPDGVWVRARAVAAGGPQPGWWQLDAADHHGAWFQRGFSGAGVWDPGSGRVIGVVAAVWQTGGTSPRVAWMIPLSLLAHTPHVAPWTPRRPADTPPVTVGASDGWGVAGPFGPVDVWVVTEALMAVTGVASDGGRALLALLPQHISSGTLRDERPRLQVFHLVRRCGDFADGPAALVRVVRQMEGDTVPVQRFVEQAKWLWPDRLGRHV